MITLPLNWIKFFHNAKFQYETMQKLFKYISVQSPGIYFSIEDISRQFSVNSNVSFEIINTLIEAGILILDSKCPECNNKIDITSEQIIECENCENEINIFTLPIAKINEGASLVDLFKDIIIDKNYELNASIVSSKIRENDYFYYLISDIESSQTQQREDPNNYLTILDKLWCDLWPNVMRSSRKASLPLLARGDAVSWIFSDKEDIYYAIEEIVLFLTKKQITKLTIYGGDVFTNNSIKEPFRRSIDRKWDLNTPSITDLYRKTNYIPKIWLKADDHVVKYCLFDGLSNIPQNNNFSFLKNGIEEKYDVTDKHKNHYEGICFAGYCN